MSQVKGHPVCQFRGLYLCTQVTEVKRRHSILSCFGRTTSKSWFWLWKVRADVSSTITSTNTTHFNPIQSLQRPAGRRGHAASISAGISIKTSSLHTKPADRKSWFQNQNQQKIHQAKQDRKAAVHSLYNIYLQPSMGSIIIIMHVSM